MNDLFTQIINKDCLFECAEQVRRNSCIGTGVDEVQCKLAVEYLSKHIDEIRRSYDSVFSPYCLLYDS